MVPVLLLTGFLGAGKTSLLNRLFQRRPATGPMSESAGKLALVVNEFGDVGIDGDLLPNEMTRQIELPGGCICCRLDGELVDTLEQIIESQENLSAIIIETTGIAEPVPISWTLAGERLQDKLRLAAILTVVDAIEHGAHRELSASVDLQVEAADLLLITKLDLTEGAVPPDLREVLRETNPHAPILPSGDEGVAALWATLSDPEMTHTPGTASSRPTDHHFDSTVVPLPEVLDFEELAEELEALGANYVRIKGIARVVDGSTGSDEVRSIAFHRVGTRVSAEPARPGLACRMVAIGSSLDEAMLHQLVARCVLPSG